MSPWGNAPLSRMSLKIVFLPLLRKHNFMFHVNKHMFSHCLPLIFKLKGGYFGQLMFAWWLISSLSIHWNKFSWLNYHFSKNGHNYCNPRKGWNISQLGFERCVKIFGCLHQEVEKTFHQFVNIMWSNKDSRDLPLFILHSFYK
jgi:hypothetical protein